MERQWVKDVRQWRLVGSTIERLSPLIQHTDDYPTFDIQTMLLRSLKTQTQTS